MLDRSCHTKYTPYMSRRTKLARPAATPAPVIVVDADGEEFALDFGHPEVSTARPAAATHEVDSLEAKLAREASSAEYRRAWYAEKEILP